MSEGSSTGVLTRKAQATYHPKGYGVSEGLARARRPFRTRNAVTAVVISSFILGVYSYSIRAVKQDDFSDVALPSEGERANAVSIEDEHKRRQDVLKAGALLEAKKVDAGVGRELPEVPGVWQRIKDAYGGSKA